jgi:hypothetical protein
MTASSPRPRHAIRIPRLLRAQLKRAIAAVEDDKRPLATRVHDMRTALRRARGVLKLARPVLRRRGREEIRRLARIARRVGVLRDAGVVIETLDRLTRQFGRDPSSLSMLRRRLEARRRALERRPHTVKALRRAGRALRRIRRRSSGLLRRAPGGPALAHGFVHEYRKARRSRKAAYRRDRPERFHVWRKVVRTHAFHVKLLAAAGVKGMEDRLGLSTRLWARRRTIRAEVRPLGRRLFAERPGTMRQTVAKGLVVSHSGAPFAGHQRPNG